MSKNALILGIGGQDGSLLADLLLKHKYRVYGTVRENIDFNKWRLIDLGIQEKVNICELIIGDKNKLKDIIKLSNPDEIYLLAGPSKTNTSFQCPKQTLFDYINASIDLLDVCIELCPHTKIFLASSSEIYGENLSDMTTLIDESSNFSPINPYGLAMLNVLQIANQYRKLHKMFISVGILFNHESNLRAKYFISRKITYHLARIQSTKGEPFSIGNLDSMRDWSAAKDIVDGIFLSLQAKESDNYIFASGKCHSVRELLKLAAKKAGFSPVFEGSGLEEKCFCSKNNILIAYTHFKHYRVLETRPHAGNSDKARKALNWTPNISFEDLITSMVQYDIKQFSINRNH
jgi:GDPmannose 4,6-dehydratase